MKAKPAAFALALIFIVMGSYAALMYQQSQFKFTIVDESSHRVQLCSNLRSYHAITIDQYTVLAFTPTINIETINTQPAIANTTRNGILDCINSNPGIAFRALCSSLCLPIGLAQYHLGVLVKSGLVSFVRDGRYKRFFVSGKYSQREMASICLLRHKTARHIFEVLLTKRKLSHSVLAEEVAISPQALTWQMKSLENSEFLVHTNDGLKVIYQLDQSTVPQLQIYLSML